MNDTSRKVSVEISSATVIKAILLVVLCAFLYVMKDLVLAVLTAVVVASSVEPFTISLIRRGIARLFSVVIIYAVLGISFAGFVYFFVPSLLSDTSSFLSTVPKYIDSISFFDPQSAVDIAKQKAVAENITNTISQSQTTVADITSGNFSISGAIDAINSRLSSVSSGFIETASGIFGGIFSFILIVVLSFYFSVQEDGVEVFLRVITPKKNEKYVINLWKRVQLKIGRWMQGQLLLALLVGILVYLGLVIFGVRNALLFAVLAALFETIPLFGPILAAIPAVATAYNDGGISLALTATGVYAIIQQFENHLFYPLVVKKIVGVPPILVILSLIVGLKLAGFLGVLLSVPIATFLVEFLDDVQRDKMLESKI